MLPYLNTALATGWWVLSGVLWALRTLLYLALVTLVSCWSSPLAFVYSQSPFASSMGFSLPPGKGA